MTNRSQAQFVAALNGLEAPYAEDFQMGVTNKSSEFLAKFPLGKVPAMECADGFCITEGAAICEYLAKSGPAADQLLGPSSEPKTQATISMWSFFAENELVSNALTIMLMFVFKMVPYDEARCNTAFASLERALKRVNAALEGGTKYLVGDKLTLADIMVVGVLFPCFKLFVDAEMRKGIPNVVSYAQGLAEQAEFKSTFGALELCEERPAKP
jgi:elongation factor 1-gamma